MFTELLFSRALLLLIPYPGHPKEGLMQEAEQLVNARHSSQHWMPWATNSTICILYKLSGQSPLEANLPPFGERTLGLLSHRYLQYKSRPQMTLYIKATIQASPGHSLSSSEFQALPRMPSNSVLFSFCFLNSS